jgi:hypothetical protein
MRKTLGQDLYPERLFVLLPRGLNSALDKLASRQHMTRSELTRQALLREIEAAGVQLSAPERAS